LSLKECMYTTLFIHSSADLYGADRCLLRIALSCRDTRPMVVVPCEGPLIGELRSRGIATVVMPIATLRRRCFTPWGLLGLMATAMRDIFRLGALVRREKVGLVYSNTTAVLMGGVVARLNGVPHVQHVREIIESPRIVGRFISQLGRLADRVVCVSDATREHFLSLCPSLAPRTVVIHDGIDLDTYRKGSGKVFREQQCVADTTLVIGMIGRISSWKGQDFFVRSAEEFVKRNPGVNVCFVIVGNAFRGQEWREQALRDRVASSPSCSVFRIVGFRDDVADVLAGLDIFTMPSTRPDPFPNTVLEAMSAAKAIVANATGGVIEMLDSGSGILVDPNNVDALCRAWEKFSSDRVLRETMGKTARLRVESCFTLSRHLSLIQDLIRDVTGSSHAARRPKGIVHEEG